ncbi:MAG: bifunctional (p)ppGpp synthetase/guanosine-3',5'-bis(diphosphate) 3'-pyrophosphohydrolase [Micromonosporaceae bacterium]|nr:bifunctional (p)ppGpp synthetase/guanosine-3',5'-bis(diphosphate) 3'-pyrophosphohydrolase [Micromonosporaceae bacterium]
MSWSNDLYAQALHFAADRHAQQCFPGTDLPYAVHVVTVAAEVMRALAEERHARPDLAVACALLHDTIEDTSTTVEEITGAFGPEVAAGVLALTKDERLPRADRMLDSLRRIREQPDEIWMVKLADRISNLTAPPPYWSVEKCRAYRAEGELIAEQLRGISDWLDRRLRERIAAYAGYSD